MTQDDRKERHMNTSTAWKAHDRLRWCGTINDFYSELTLRRLRVEWHHHFRSHSPPTGHSGHALLHLMTWTHTCTCLQNRSGPGCSIQIFIWISPRLWWAGSTAGSWAVRGMGVSVMTGLGSGDLSMGLSSRRSWWIQRSGGFRSLDELLYLWEPVLDLQAARFLKTETHVFNRKNNWSCSWLWIISYIYIYIVSVKPDYN